MKKILAFVLAAVMLLGLCACQNAPETPDTPETTTVPALDVTATDADIAQLDNLYAGRQAYHGELHDHADTGGTSDGRSTLEEWKEEMAYVKDMDFATIADHKQVLHMRLEEWDNSLFIGGSEAGTSISDSKATQNKLHYNMLFAEPEGLENVLNAFPSKYLYISDHFKYPSFTTEEFGEVIDAINANGGFFVHVHPCGDDYLVSDDSLDYWFGDNTGLEVLCGYYGNMSAQNNQEAYKVWTDLLAMGKRVYATSGSDSHKLSNTVSLTTIYSEKQDAKTYLDYVRSGNFTAGPVGIRMCVGDTPMGGTGSFAGKRVVVSAGDFHSLEFNPGRQYRIDLYDDKGLVGSQEVNLHLTSYIAVDADASSKFYRAEVYDMTEGYIVALGNPIWNDQVA